MNCYPLPPSYTYKHSHSYSGYQPHLSTKSLHSNKSSTKSKPRWSRKSSKQSMPGDDFEKGLMRTSQESRSYSTFSSADSMQSRSTSTSSDSDSSMRKPSMSTKSTKSSKTNKSTDSNKSSRSWIKRIFVGETEEEDDETREAKRRERNAMWRNMSMGYESVHVYADVGEFIGR